MSGTDYGGSALWLPLLRLNRDEVNLLSEELGWHVAWSA